MAKYDIVVVGAGNAGLSAALQAQLAGRKTLLIEQHNLPGGAATSFRRGRFEIEPSLHELCDFGPADNPGDIRNILDAYGVKLDWIECPDCFRIITKGSDGKTLDVTMPSGVQNFIDAMEQELAPIPGESMSLGDIDRAIADLGRQFTALLSEAAVADNADGYTARFQSISTAMAEFKRRKAIIQQLRQEQDQANHRMQRVTMALKSTSNKLTDWDDGTIYQLLEKVTVLSRERIRVTLRDGLEIEQAVEQPKRRKFA